MDIVFRMYKYSVNKLLMCDASENMPHCKAMLTLKPYKKFQEALICISLRKGERNCM